MPQSHSSGSAQSTDAEKVFGPTGSFMESLHSMVMEIFHLSQDRSILARFEETMERWFDGLLTYREAQLFHNECGIMVAKLRRERDE